MMKNATDQREMWRRFFEEKCALLAIAAEMVSQVKGASEQILGEALLTLECSPYCTEFAQCSAIRAVVKAGIARNVDIHLSPLKEQWYVSADDLRSEGRLVEELPWPERATFFLSKILSYSRRDCALLLGISDANVDRLVMFAERRMAGAERISNLSSEVLAEIVQGNGVSDHGEPQVSSAFE